MPAINHVTWLLNPDTGDTCLDSSGNIATISGAAAVAQDVATQLSTFLGECWYDSTQGVPYWQQILGKLPPASLVASLLEAQALLVPDVVSATATIGGISTQSVPAVGASGGFTFGVSSFGSAPFGASVPSATLPARGVIGQMVVTDTGGNVTTFAIGSQRGRLGILSTQYGSPITLGGSPVEI